MALDTASALASRPWDGSPIAYPDPAIQTLDPRFKAYAIGNTSVDRLVSGLRWGEGPVWFGDGRYLIFSDIPNNRMLRWDEQTGATSVFRQPSNNTNGNTRDRQGRLISCEHGSRRVTRTEHTGDITVLMDSFNGKRLNAPNDVVVHSDGSIWFTDPGYGIMSDYEGERSEFELKTAIYRIDPATGKGEIVADDFERPNGLCFSPDESKLYVVDTGIAPSPIRVFDVANGKLSGGGEFVNMKGGSSDGIRTDYHGNLWSAAGWGGAGFDGVHVFAPNGDLIGQILLPEPCSNLCFGGRRKDRLFMTCGQSLYSVFVGTRGAQVP